MSTNYNSNSRTIVACFISCLMILGQLAPIASARPGARRVSEKSSSKTENANAPAPVSAPAPFAPNITATQTDSFPDPNFDGKADPGETITYTATISNTGPDPATGVQFTDTIDANTTLVPGSLKISPLAFDDTYVAAQNTPLSVGAPGVLTNDTGTPAPTAVPIAGGATTQGGTVTLNADGSFLYTPAAAFAGTDTFTYTATNGQLPNNTATVTITVDAPPSVSSTTPANAATNQALNANISITFSEAVNVTGNWFQVVCTSSGTRNVADTVVTGGPTTFTINPNADFTSGETCTVTVAAAQVSDQDANDPPDNMTADHVFSFAITSEVAPTVTSTTPTNGATGVVTNSNLSVTFSEPVNVAGNWFQIVCGTSGTRNVANTVVSGGPTTFTINPNADFAQNETCTVTVFAAQVTDVDANDPPDNMAANFVFSYTTDAAPSVTATTPTNGATNQPGNTDVTVTFSEAVNVTGSWFQISCATSGNRTTANSVITGGPTTFTINPNSDFVDGELCTATIFAAQVTDQDANDPPDTMAANFVFSFTIDAGPSVTATTPTNGATQQANNTNLTITFNEAVNVTGNWFQIVGATSGTRNVADTVVSGGPTVFTINPNVDFANGEVVTVTVFAAQVTDQDANDPPDNMAANFVFSFTIDVAPSVTATTPTNGATAVAATTNISITFSEAVNVTGNWFQVVCGAQTKNPADTAVTGGPTTFTINPTTDLLAGNVCQVTVFAAQVADQDAGDPPDNMTADFVFSFSVPPVAVNDTYAPTIVGNVGINTDNSTDFSILANDTPTTVTTINTSGTSANGGTVVVAADGKFSYVPAAGFEGADSFTYTITNAAGTSNSATVNLTVTGMIWFINAAAGAGNGRLATPFNSVASFQALNVGGGNNPAAGDNIFIFENASSYTGPITLLSNQKLIGQDATATLAAISGVLVPADSFPLPAMNTGAPATTLNSSSAGVNAVNLNGAATANTVRGLTLTTGSATSKGISGTSFGTLTTADVMISGSGPAIDINTGSLAGSFNSVSSSGGANGVRFNGIGGSSSLGFGSLSGATAEEFLVIGGTVTLTFDGIISTIAAGSRPVSISNKTTSGNVTFNGSVTASTFASGVNLDNNDGATITFAGGLSLSTEANTAFNAINGGTVVATQNNTSIINTLTTTTGTALNIANTNIGLNGVTFRSIAANGGTNGIVLNSTGTTAGVHGGLTVTGTDGGDAGTLPDNGTGGTIQNTTGDSISLSTTRSVALGGMTITNSGNNNAANDNSNWIDATSVVGITLLNVNATDSVGHGFLGSSVTNLVIQDGLYRGGGIDNVTNFNPATPAGDANFHGFFITNLLGTSSITGTTFERSNTVQFRVNNNSATNFAGTPDTLTVSDTTWQLHGRPTFAQNPGAAASPFHGDHLSVSSDTGANFRVNVDSSVGQNVCKSGGICVQAAAGGTNGKMDANISGIQSGGNTGGGSPTFNDDSNTAMAVIGETGGGSITYDILNNTSLGTGSVAIKVTHASVPGGTSSGTISNNIITHVAGSGTDAIGFDLQPNGIATTQISFNTITGNYQRGILVQALGGTGQINATVNNNTLTGSAPDGLQHFVVINGGSGGGHLNTIRLNMHNNTVNPGGTYTAAYRLVSNDAGSTFQLQDLVGAGTVANVQNWITTVKANAGTPVAVDATVPYTATAGPVPLPPATPLLFAPGGVEAAHDAFSALRDFGSFPIDSTNFVTRTNDQLATSLSQRHLVLTVASAIERWNATGLTANQLALLRGIKFEVGDLAVGFLGQADSNRIVIDRDAGGKGWFIDSSPLEDSEFNSEFTGARRYTSPSNQAAGRIDLLTAIEHELGHRLGLPDSYDARDRDSIMYGYLTTGERRSPSSRLLAHGVPGLSNNKHFLMLSEENNPRGLQDKAGSVIAQQQKKRPGTIKIPGPVPPTPSAGETINPNIGTIPAGESVTITYQVTVNSPYLGGPNVSNQGTVSGGNFANVLTDDPAVGGANDPTLTPILLNPNISVSNAQANEPATGSVPMLFTISLASPAPAGGTTVHYSTADQAPGAGHAVAGVDYTAVPDTVLSFAAGEQFKTVTVNILADADAPEPDETFELNLSNPTNGVIVDAQGIGTIKQGNAAGTFLISELRTSGPGGLGDDFVEFYNNTDFPLTVAASDASAGYGLYKMGADCNATPVLIGVIPNGTVIPARGHFLMVGSQYSLGDYGGTGAAAGNLTLSSDIESDRNVAVFTTSDALAISSANRLDAVGFGTNTGGICDLLREGTNSPPVSGSTTQHTFYRDSCGKSGGPAFGACPSNGSLVDTNDNNTNFVFADTQGTFIVGVPQRLGAPGPENLASPIRRDPAIASVLLDQTVGAGVAPNRVRDLTSNPGNNSTFGTLSVRRRFINNTGANVTRLRFRVVDISTFPSPGGGIADLRPITSANVTVNGVNDGATCLASTGSAVTPCSITVKGTTLEQPPAQPNGGGWNSSLADGTITLGTPLAAGASANLQFLLGVQSTGSFKFYIIVEALP